MYQNIVIKVWKSKFVVQAINFIGSFMISNQNVIENYMEEPSLCIWFVCSQTILKLFWCFTGLKWVSSDLACRCPCLGELSKPQGVSLQGTGSIKPLMSATSHLTAEMKVLSANFWSMLIQPQNLECRTINLIPDFNISSWEVHRSKYCRIP